jgi:alpha-glucosidase
MNRLNEPIGAHAAHRRTETGLWIRAANAEVEVDVFSDRTFRIQAWREAGDRPRPSWAATAEPSRKGWSVAEEDGRLVLSTGRAVLDIALHPVRFRLCTPAGRLLNADDPSFGISWLGGETTVYKTLRPGERFIGLGEKTGGLDRTGSAHTNWNSDVYAYPVDGRDSPLYATFPFYIGIHGRLVYGVYLDSTWRTRFNFGAANDRFASFSTEGGAVRYYLFAGEGVADLLESYTAVTGRMPLPPLWSLGYHQSRYSYRSQGEVLRVARTFRDKGIPCDAVHLDIHHMDGFRVFTWDPEGFPDPSRMARELKALGFRVVVILDPGIKIEPGYGVYEDGLARGVFLAYPDGVPYAGEVWPGWCHFPDFTRPATRRWWGDMLRESVETGVDGFWNDMNEPAVRGHAVPDLVECDGDGCRTSLKEGRNLYGMLMARSTREGVARWMGDRRPFVLTRSGFAGVQRDAALWTGDNVASDAHMLAGARMVTALGLAGMGFVGCDIGGFVGEATPDLYARWIALGAFQPFARGHTDRDTRSAEPWAFGEAAERVAADYLRLRYRLLPYIYSAFWECSRTGMPVARSLAIAFPHDDRVYDPAYDGQYLFGPSILVVPVPGGPVIARAYLPDGLWYDFYTDRPAAGAAEITVEAPAERLPLFVRAGSVLPMQAPVLHTGQRAASLLELHVYPGDGEGGFTYYEDDGETLGYRRGHFFRRRIVLRGGDLILEPASGRLASRYDRLRVWFHGGDPPGALRVDGAAVPTERTALRLFEPVVREGAGRPASDPHGRLELVTATVPHRREGILIEPA